MAIYVNSEGNLEEEAKKESSPLFRLNEMNISFLVGSTVILTGLITAMINSSWTPFLSLGLISLISLLILNNSITIRSFYKYLVSIIFGLLGSMLLLQADGFFALHFGIFFLATGHICLKSGRSFIPFTLIILAAINGLGIAQNETKQPWFLQHVEEVSAEILLSYSAIVILCTVLCAFFSEILGKIIKSKDSIKEALKSLKANTEKNISFANKIAKGEFNTDFQVKDGDTLGLSLIEMSKSLKEAAIEEKQRNWAIEGIAKIADILRMNHNNLEELSYNVISHLVKYINANQGGIFILNEDNPDNVFLELKGCYAYNRKKFIEKKIAVGQGLVGQAYLEKDIIYMTEVPDNYVQITSGLGEANPNSIMIVPLKVEEQVIGVIELASFRKFQKHEEDFLMKVSENIASAIITSKVNHKTNILLRESQELTEQLRAQEEEMRQNMEELQATQESLQRESEEKEKAQNKINKTLAFLENVINAIPEPLFVKDHEHRILMINNAYLQSTGSQKEDLLGKNDFDLFKKEDAEVFYAAEEKLFQEKSEIVMEEAFERNGKIFHYLTKKKIIEDSEGNLFLVGTNIDITERKKMEEELRKEKYLLDALMMHPTDRIYFKDKESKFLRVSHNMLELYNFTSQEQILGKSDFDFYDEEHALPAYNGEQEIIKTGKPILNLIEKETWKDGSVTYVTTTKMPLKDLSGSIVGTFGISRDITEFKLDSEKLKKQEKLLISLLDYSEASIAYLDKTAKYNFLSPKLLAQLGYTHEAINGKNISDFIHKEDLGNLEKYFKPGKSGKQIQVRHLNAKGHYEKTNVEVSLLKDGEFEGFILKFA